MDPTNQGVVPVTLYRGSLASGTTTVSLTDTYDHVIAGIALFCTYGETGYITIEDDAGAQVYVANMANPATSTEPAAIVATPFIVLQSQTELKLITNIAGLGADVSAYRLNPSAAILFS